MEKAKFIKKFKPSDYNRQELSSDQKLCPFQSNPDQEIPCSPRCALYRDKKAIGFNCPLSEITSMSFRIKQISDRK